MSSVFALRIHDMDAASTLRRRVPMGTEAVALVDQEPRARGCPERGQDAPSCLPQVEIRTDFRRQDVASAAPM
ncbi:MAG: hypothetical protein WCL53_01495 [Chloroflexota bacterium]